MLLRRLLLPALICVPAVQWTATLAFRSDYFDLELPGVGDLAVGMLLNAIGIVIACWPAERLSSQYNLRPAVSFFTMIVAGATGGFAMGAVVAGLAWQGGLLGIAPGAVVAFVWALFNLDLLARKKDIPLG